jgi:hypothetical protein
MGFSTVSSWLFSITVTFRDGASGCGEIVAIAVAADRAVKAMNRAYLIIFGFLCFSLVVELETRIAVPNPG